MILTSPVVGALADHFGSLALMAFLTICGCSAVLFLLLAVSVPVDNLLFLFSIGMGLMASATSIIMVKTGMVFADDNEPQQNGEVEKEGLPGEEKTGSHNNKRKDQNQSRVISILNALFDAGSVTYLGLWGMFKLDLSLSSIVGIYLGLAVFCLGGASIFWYTLGDPVSSPPTSRALTEQSSIEIDADDNPNETPSATKSDLLELPNDTEKVTPSAPIERTLTPEISTASALSENAKSSPAIAQSSYSSYVLVSERPPRKQLLSLPFIMLLLFFAVNLARNMFVLTTARDFLRYLADDEESGETYLTIFTLLMPASLFGLPFSDQVITHFGFHTGFQIVCLLGVVHGLIQISCDELNGVQILGFLVFSFYRCFLFSIVFSYLPTLLAPNVVGKGVGALHMAGGILSFLNIPLSNVAVKYLDGNFFVPNLVYTILAVPCAAAAYLIGQTIKKEAPVKEAAG